MNFLRNSWYCAGWAADLQDRPTSLTIMNELIVFYRDAEGTAVALEGRCPHRFAPLSMGAVFGDTIMCPYHGLRFAPDGQCVLNPHGDGHIPPQARLKPYPLVERNGVLWIWMGDPARADKSLISDQNYLVDPAFSSRTGYYKVEANYLLVVDNLLDLTHGPFLHANTLMAPRERASWGAPTEFAGELRHKVWAEQSAVHSDYMFPPMPVTGLARPLIDDDIVVMSADMTWRPGSTLDFDQKYWRPDDTAGDPILNMPSMHYLVPETEFSTHYFYAIAHDATLEDDTENDRLIALVQEAFAGEDGPIISACQQLMGTSDLFSLKPAILKTDQAAVLARRLLDKLIKAEAAGVEAEPVREDA